MKTFAVLFVALGLACTVHGQELTCKMQSSSQSTQLDVNESDATVFWHGGGGIRTTGTGKVPAVFTSDKITWSYRNAEDDSLYNFELFRFTGVLWQHEGTHTGWSTLVWDCAKSERKI